MKRKVEVGLRVLKSPSTFLGTCACQLQFVMLWSVQLLCAWWFMMEMMAKSCISNTNCYCRLQQWFVWRLSSIFRNWNVWNSFLLPASHFLRPITLTQHELDEIEDWRFWCFDVVTSSGLVLSTIWCHLGYNNEDVTNFDTSRIWVTDGIFVLIPFGSIYCARTLISEQNRPSINID